MKWRLRSYRSSPMTHAGIAEGFFATFEEAEKAADLLRQEAGYYCVEVRDMRVPVQRQDADHTMKFCVACQHLDSRMNCARPLGTPQVSLVTGIALRRIPTDAQYERETRRVDYFDRDYRDVCGPEAIYFTPKGEP